jgi:hypothetical protein
MKMKRRRRKKKRWEFNLDIIFESLKFFFVNV